MKNIFNQIKNNCPGRDFHKLFHLIFPKEKFRGFRPKGRKPHFPQGFSRRKRLVLNPCPSLERAG